MQQHRAVVGQDGFDAPADLIGAFDVQGRDIEGPGHGDEVGVVVQVYLALPVAVEQLLLLAHHAKALVVHHDEFYRQVVAADGGQFLGVHHE